MSTYREFLLLNSGRAQDFTFDQALRWMDAYERFELGKAELRPKKKRASRLSTVLAELEQPAPARSQSSPLAKLQPIFRNADLEASLPDEPASSQAGPVFASYRDSHFDTAAFAASARDGWELYRRRGATKKGEVFFSPLSPNRTDGTLQNGRAEFQTQAIQVTEIFTRMLCSEDPRQRESAATFERPAHRAKYTGDSVEVLDPDQFAPDAAYLRDGQQVAVFLPCAFWWNPVADFRQYISWLIEQSESRNLGYELWQPGLIRNLRS